jgi:hypothetical protein
MINSQGHLSNPIFGGVKPCLSGSGSGLEVLCCVRVCESMSLRHSLVMKRVQSPDLQVCGGLRWSRVSPNRACSPGQEMLKSCEEGGRRQMKKVVLFVFPCVLEGGSLTSSQQPSSLPSLCLDVWQMGRMEGGQSKNTP